MGENSRRVNSPPLAGAPFTGGQLKKAPTLAMSACRRLAGMKLHEIVRLFGVSGYSAVSSVVGKTKARPLCRSRDSDVSRGFAKLGGG